MQIRSWFGLWRFLRLGLILSVALAGAILPMQPSNLHAQPPGDLLYAVTSANRLIQFNSATPGTVIATRSISGLQVGENLLGIDFRPADGQLYAVGSTSRLYTINPQTGAASVAVATPFTATLNGTALGVDFNPTVDRLRVVSNNEQNLRINPITGLSLIDSSLAYTTTDANTGADPEIVAAAYTSNISGSTPTTLYVIDADLNILARQGGLNGPPSPNGGSLFTVGALGVDASDLVGFDITPGGAAYAAITPEAATTSNLYTIDLTTGTATPVGAIGGGETIVGLAAPTVPAPALPAETLYGVTSAGRLIRFNSATPGTVTAAQPISGLQTGETVLGLDARPVDGRLYALGSTSRIYTIDPATAVATLVGAQPFTSTLNGTDFGFDFNPSVDRIRVVSEADQNLRLHPDTGATAGVDASLAYTVTDVFSATNPTIVGAAYTNNVNGGTPTTLYVIDADLDILARQGGVNGLPSPNGGNLFTVGKLGVDASNLVGFDISPTGVAFAAFTPPSGSVSDLALVNLTTGLVTRVGAIGSGESLVALAVATAPPPPTPQTPVFAVTSANRLIRFNSATPGVLTGSQPISGLQTGENILSIDFRPADGRLYALGSSSRLYTVNPQTGAATLVGAQPFSPTLSGGAFGFDFNPVPDRIRVVSDGEQNLRLHPVTGVTAGIDATLAYTVTDSNAGSDPTIVAAAYTNNFSGTTATTLYVIDANLNTLALQGGANGTPSPNTGRLFTVGALGVDASSVVGFDIAPSGAAFVATSAPAATTSNFYTVDLAAGKLQLVGAIGSAETVVGLAVPTIAPPPPPAQPIFALTNANRLIRFSSATPGLLTLSTPVVGLQAGENLLGIDFRPADGRLYGVSSEDRVYTINPLTGAASPVANQPFSSTLSGAAFGFDFNPVPDRIRVVSNEEQNLRLHPVTGVTAGVDGTLAYTVTDVFSGTNPTIVGAAYTNNISGATSTTLYVIDAGLDTLALQGGPNGTPSPNTGRLFTVGSLGVDTTNAAGFDIAPSGAAFAALTPVGNITSTFYVVDLASGKLQAVGAIGSTETVIGLAAPTVSPPPPPAEPIYGVTSANRLILFSSTNPGAPLSVQAISGLQPGETLVGLDFRPVDGRLYGLGSSSRLYLLDPQTGAAAVVGGRPFSSTLSGAAFGFDFNPVPDRLRVVSEADQNLRLHPDTGATAGVDTTLAYTTTDLNASANPTVVGAAYTNNVAGVTSTTLYVIDAGLDVLAIQGGPGGVPSPNGGRLITVGRLGMDVGNVVGFDITPTGAAFATVVADSITNFYAVDLAAGRLRLLGAVGGLNVTSAAGGAETIVDLTSPTWPPALVRHFLPIVSNTQ